MTTPGIENLELLSGYSIEVLEKFPVRKTKSQKQSFKQYVVEKMQELGWDTRVQTSGSLVKNNNIVAGDPASAKIVLTAHYDTPARLPFPNFMTPFNLPLIILIQLAIAIILFLPAVALFIAMLQIGIPFLPAYFGFVALLVLATWFLLAGPANPSNVNDNTSGVLVLLEAAQSLPEELRKNIAIVFFDNEEIGLVGSAAFRKEYGKMEHAVLLNFDCTGNGDTLAFFPSSGLRGNLEILKHAEESFALHGERKVFVSEKGFFLYPSDQMLFPKSFGVAALSQHPVAGYYINRIHTSKDTVMQAQNIVQLSQGIPDFASTITSAGKL